MVDNLYPPDLQHLTSVYLALLISGGQIGLPIVVLTAVVCKKVTWHPTIINFCITWIVYSIIYCLYLYDAGMDTETRSSKICMVQASMIHGAAPMTVVAGLAIVVHMWTMLQCVQHNVYSRVTRLLYLTLMLGTPYLVFIAFSVAAVTFASSHSQAVYSNGLYCVTQLGHPVAVVPCFCAAVMVIILALEAIMTLQYYRQWKIIKTSFPLATQIPSRSVCFRVGLFCLYCCVTLTSAILFLSDLQTTVTYMLPAALPLCALIVIGLQKGAISLWTTVLRWREHPSFELGVPSARAASMRSDLTLTPTALSEETGGCGVPV